MLLGEPAPTQFDLNFSVFGFPVRVHPMFWIITLILVLQRDPTPMRILIWVFAVFVSILIHELGHAFAFRRFGSDAWITLHGFGGLAASNRYLSNSRQRIIVSAAGPGAGFIFALVLLLALFISGHMINIQIQGYSLLTIGGSLSGTDINAITHAHSFAYILFGYIVFSPLEAANLNILVSDLLYINVLWGLLNLLPIYPLDGGQISREIFVKQSPGQGIAKSLKLSIFTASALAIYAAAGLQRTFLAFMCGYLAYLSITALINHNNQGDW